MTLSASPEGAFYSRPVHLVGQLRAWAARSGAAIRAALQDAGSPHGDRPGERARLVDLASQVHGAVVGQQSPGDHLHHDVGDVVVVVGQGR